MSDLRCRRRFGWVALTLVLAGAVLAAAWRGQMPQTDAASVAGADSVSAVEPVSSATAHHPSWSHHEFTFDDYVAGFRRYIDCTTGRTAQAGLDAATMRSAAPHGEEWEQYVMIDWNCYETHFYRVDVWRQTTREQRDRQRWFDRGHAERNPTRHVGSGLTPDRVDAALRLGTNQRGA